jgi:hypothetical protein
VKDLSYDAEPFLDFEMTAERLARYPFIYAPNVACLSDAQCSMLAKYVEDGGMVLATHLTSAADEFGRLRTDYGLADLFGATLRSPEPLEIPDLYVRPVQPFVTSLPCRDGIPQDPQVILFGSYAQMMAVTYDRGHRRNLGPAIITRRQGKGRVIYIGSGLEAVYDETLNESLRTYFHSLLDPILEMTRNYDVAYRPGLSCQFASSSDVLLLHLFANTGNIWKKLLVQESFLPIENVRVRLRLPPGRTAKSASLLWSGVAPSWNVRNGWVELSIPQVHPYEVVRVDLHS